MDLRSTLTAEEQEYFDMYLHGIINPDPDTIRWAAQRAKSIANYVDYSEGSSFRCSGDFSDTRLTELTRTEWKYGLPSPVPLHN